MACSCDFSPDEALLLRAIFEYVLKYGRSPTINELQSSLARSYEDIIHIVDALEEKDALLRKKETQEIVSIYPFSMVPTKHQVIFEDGPRLFAMCAVDALGAPSMFAKDANVESRCEECRQKITFGIKSGQLASISHPGATICSVKTQIHPMAVNCCPSVNFFCSKRHAGDWIADNPRLMNTISLGSAKQRFPEIRECWIAYGEMLGLR